MRDILTLLLILHFVFKNFSKTKQSHLKNKNTKNERRESKAKANSQSEMFLMGNQK